MKRAFATLALPIFIVGCGGGNGSSATTPPTPAPQYLAAYIGTWAGTCQFHALDSATITRTPGTTDSINIANKTEYFSGTDCTGSVLATETESGVVTAKYVATVDSSIIFPPSTTGTASKVDQITASRPASNFIFTGSAVHTVQNGQAVWCIDFGGGNSTCVQDNGTQPGMTGAAGGLFLQGNTMYVLDPNGNVYSVNQVFTKK